MTTADIYSYMESLRKKRSTSTTQQNQMSSRSHLISTISVSKRTNKSTVSNTSFVDLAGFESLSNESREVTTFINNSVLSLQQVVTALIDESKVVPFRDSNLTRVLQPLLTFESKIVVFATVGFSEKTLRGDLNSLRSLSAITGRRKNEDNRSHKSHTHSFSKFVVKNATQS